MSAPLRVALLVSERPARWQMQTLRSIEQSGHASSVGVFCLDTPAPHTPEGVANLLYDIGDRILFAGADDALAPVSRADATVVQRVSCDGLAAWMRGSDLLLCLVPLEPRVLDALSGAGSSLWWIAGTTSGANAEFPGRSETLRGESVTSIGVASVNAPGGALHWRSVAHLATDARSAHRSRCLAAQRVPDLVGDALRDACAPAPSESDLAAGAARDLADGGRGAGLASARDLATAQTGKHGTVRGAARLARRLLSDKWDERRWQENWGLAFALDPANPFDPVGFERLLAPAGGLYADPFPIVQRDGFLVFLEEVRPGSTRGVISMLEIAADGRPGTPEVVIEAPHHLSYPFVFRWDETWWMVPESADAGRVELWRCEEWPLRWRRERVLLEGLRAFDATLHELDGVWWMFASVETHATSGFEALHLYQAQSPLGPFTSHPRNPVLRDVRCARSAGRIVRDGEHWIRPAQDCSRRYGGATVLRRIDRLDPEGLCETSVGRIDPWAADVCATHTWNRAGALVVVDAVFRHRR